MLNNMKHKQFADTRTLYNHMLEKDATYSKLRSERCLQKHPSLVESFRTILFEWLSEVSQECKFHRETYHLALDLIDRYLAAAQTSVKKNQLQLIGTTCLFLAAKYEEIRPPTANEFAETTAGACTADEIIDNEVVILSAINWDITPLTPNSWLNFYMHQLTLTPEFVTPTGQTILMYKHKRIAATLDLALLHVGTLKYSNSKLVAAAVYWYFDEKAVQNCSGLCYEDIHEIVLWLRPFVETIDDQVEELTIIKICNEDIDHATQMHSHLATVSMMDQVDLRIKFILDSQRRKAQYVRSRAIERDEEDTSEDSEEADSGIGHSNQAVVLTDVNSNSLARPSSTSDAVSPQKPTSTALMTPPSSTSKARRKRHRGCDVASTSAADDDGCSEGSPCCVGQTSRARPAAVAIPRARRSFSGYAR